MTKASGFTRVGLSIAVAAASALVVVTISCSDKTPGASMMDDASPTNNWAACTDEGCSCAAGTVAACGQTYTADKDFLYCYEGSRSCVDGKLGPCENGTLVPKSKNAIYTQSASSGMHTMGFGTGTTCTAPSGTKLQLCTGGTKAGEVCLVALDCPGGGTCDGYVGVCKTGTRNGEGCNGAADCPPTGGCETGIGLCLGGPKNAKKCRHDSQCGSGGTCTAEDADAGTLVNPCDPNCNIFADTALGLAPTGFVLTDGGIMPGAVGEVCGNGIKGSSEQCDDGNTTNGDGCSSTCQIDPGFQCPTAGSPCTPSTCGNGIVEGLEQCDDSNNRPYDGCSPTCTKDFNCPAGAACTAVCGDGLKFPGEACDDGNTANGDGCSSTCTVETGATCNQVTAPPAAYIDVPIIYRDFTPGTSTPYGSTAPAHPDFEFETTGTGLPHGKAPGYSGYCTGQVTGIAAANLAADKEPVMNATQGCTKGATYFSQWYRDTPGVNQTILGKFLRLKYNGTAYVFDSANDPEWNSPDINCGNALGPHTTCKGTSMVMNNANAGYSGFFPINGMGYGNFSTYNKNFHFTSEVRYPFTYHGGEVLGFSGDDDVFVYIAGKLVVDLGGFHGVAKGSATLNAAGNADVRNCDPASCAIDHTVSLGLVAGNTYEIDVFQAERHVTGSNYKLTLQGFDRQVSQCNPPPSNVVYYRDYQAVCAPGSRVEWQLLRWQAGVPLASQIELRAATADTQAALPAAPPAASPITVPIGTATPTNSPVLPIKWANDTNAGPPVTPRPVSQSFTAAGISSKQWLRVYMSFSGLPVMYQWQQLYDCVPEE